MANDPATNMKTPATDARNAELGASAAEELRKTVRRALGDLFGNFLKQLPQALVVSAQNISTPGARDGFQVLARSVPANENRWLETFISKVDGNLIGDVKARQEEKSTPSAQESFVLANLELRAEELHQNIIAQLDARLERVRQNVYIPIHVKALAPAGLCRALQETAEVLEWPGDQRRVLFEKFDDLVVNELGVLYQSLLDALTRINTIVSRAPAPASKPAAPAATPEPEAKAPPRAPEPATAPAAPKAPAPEAKAPESRPESPYDKKPPTFTPTPAAPSVPLLSSALLDSPRPVKKAPPVAAPQVGELPPLRLPYDPDKLDSKTASMLETVACNDSGTVYSDGTLAAELLAISKHDPLPDLAEDKVDIPLQRMNLAGHFLSEAIADPLIPTELKKQHESVRFPLVKSAIADETFFTAVTHPLRSLVNELMLKSATSRVTGSAETRRIADLLQQVLVQFDLAPSFVREAMLHAQPLADQQMKLFEKMQRQQAQQRRESVISEAKRIVAHELEQTTFTLSIPESVTAFLNKIWAPLLMKRLLQYGMESTQWKEAVKMMEDLIHQLEDRQHDQPPPEEWKALLQNMIQALKAGGMSDERIHPGINSLEAARRTPAFDV